MSIDSVNALLQVVRRTRLLTPDQVEEVARELGPYYDDPADLAQYLAQVEWLTPYQVQVLFSDDPDELVVGPYVVLDRLGEGGVSEVFKAWDTIKGRDVALKVLRQHLAERPDALQQFLREKQAITRLSHPNIIKTYDADHVGAVHYFAMEFVEGMDLDRFVQRVGPLSVGQACDYVRQAAQGLQHAHQLGLVHRDIKPANLFLLHPPLPTAPGSRRGPDPVVKVLDWGLARLLPGPGEQAASTSHDTDTEKGMLIGTADYIAPEQARDASVVDVRADIYSLGCTFYYLLTGRPPFPGPSLMQKLMQHQQREPEPIQAIRPDVPPELAAVIQRMMAKKPEDRFQIPLLVVAPLRRFCQAAPSPHGSGIRPVMAAKGAVSGASSAAGRNDRPSAAAETMTSRPPSSTFNMIRPGEPGHEA